MLKKTQIGQKNRNYMAFLFPFLCCLLMLLTGCVNYDVGINFNSPHNGNIVQHIKIGQQLNNLDRSDVKKWLNSIESRSRKLQGKVKKPNAEELIVTIPFRNGKELATKFNQLFHSEIPATSAVSTAENSDLTKLDSYITLKQNNLLLLERNSLDLAIDLRALNILTRQDKITINSDRLIDLDFQLNTPWLAYSASGENNLQPIPNSPTKKLMWHLQPGEINYIKAVFWLPSPLGIGAVAITVLMILGFYLKYQRFPGVAS
ncbi:conserved hypothetical protein [Hyella patelloides LEGE 07179]|uniref:DUF3153 domain-containing protein n=1 Tax=Hyella patelloides LEGE 07179 TaxID=945734 RepID=A0A563VLT0_9CYAN|nr:DUF3153 domain-containing protein [Hyella patelloides]VEP12410.1 conserved hypothetical protein [Hyella patelloides LEGE 07179]